MKIFVVVETTGGWGGTAPFTHVYRAFSSSDDAEAYCAKRKAEDIEAKHRQLWDGEVFECELE